MQVKNLLLKMRKYLLSHANLISYVLLCIAILIFSFSSSLGYLAIYKKIINADQYDSQAHTQLANPKHYTENYHALYKSIEVSGDFSIQSGSLPSPYMGIFQTSDYNNGLRLEVGKKDANHYTLGIIINNKNSRDGALGYSIGNPPYELVPGKTYRFSIAITKNKLLHDDLFIRSGDQYTEILGAPDQVHGDFSDIVIDKIKLGSGYDDLRKLHGQISNFTLKYTYYLATHLDEYGPLVALCFFLVAMILAGVGNKNRFPDFYLRKHLKFFLLAPLIFDYPILQLYAVNLINVSFFVILKIILMTSLLAVLLFALLVYTYKDAIKALIALIFASVFILFSGRIFDNINFLITSDWFILICSLIMLLIHFSLNQFSAINNHVATILSRVIYLLFIMSIISVSYQYLKIATAANQINKEKDNNLATAAKINRPDIYFIISDMHASQVSLQKHFGRFNNRFYSHLRSLGFYQADNARSNYKLTFLSIPSMMNLETIPKEVNSYDKLRQYYDRNKLASFLKQIGYKYIFISPRRYIIDHSSIADYNFTCSKMSDFEGTLWGYSMFFRMNKFGDTYRNDVLCGLDTIKKVVSIQGPKFVFAHLLSPHPPYVFDRYGNAVPFGEQFDFNVSTSRIDLNKKGYLEQLKFISKKLSNLVDFILANSKTMPIIILQGDHGFSLYSVPEFNSGKRLPPDDFINARMRPLAAYLFPYGGNQVLYNNISPMNMTRALLRYYFHRTDLKKIDDKSYWTPNDDIFQFTDVTATINKQNASASEREALHHSLSLSKTSNMANSISKPIH